MNTIALTWRTSSYSGSNGGECVEVAFDGDQVLVRDSKYLRDPANDPATQPVISVPRVLWPTFLAAAANAELRFPKHGLPSITRTACGDVQLRSADGTSLAYTAAEWIAFTSGAKDGEFAAA